MSTLARAKKQGKVFLAPVPTQVGSPAMIFKVLWLHLQNKNETVPKQELGPFHTEVALYQRAPESGLRVTWFGHSSTMVEMDGVRLLLDPVWDDRAGPLSWLGPKRFFAPTLDLATLPAIDAVLLSHDHYDHLGKATVKHLARAMPALRWIVPAGVGKLLHRLGVPADRVTELDWTEQTVVSGAEMGVDLEVTALPARHFSGRAPWNRNHTLWMSYALRGPKHNIYFGADSGMWDGFETIGREYGPFDLTMLEIGAYNDLWKDIHMGPDGAARTLRALGGGLLMPIHWGLFNLALHGWRQPMERITELAAQQNLLLFAPEPGRPTEVWPGETVTSGWWRSQADEPLSKSSRA